uniref:Myosin_tail_1 domain-containing protein n=1 Tax=Angiostrongylus cantonensis TaxID=6313 RepID=A0A0K0CUM4_ANGCA
MVQLLDRSSSVVVLDPFLVEHHITIEKKIVLIVWEKRRRYKTALNAFDEEENDWWSVMIKRPDAQVTMSNPQCATPPLSSSSEEEFSGMSVSRSSFVTPCGPNRRRKNSINLSVHTIARCDGSPLLEAINSPKVRELRREREIRTLRRQLNEIEDQLMNSELQVSESRNKIESLIGEIAKKNERIRDLESNGKLSQRSQAELEAKVVLLTKHLEGCQHQCHSQKERLAAYKLNVEGLEEKQMDLSEQLETKSSSIAALERELRDVKDEAVKSLQQVRLLDNERNTLMRLLEEERQAATSEREQYQGAISEWRKRLEAETANAMSIYSNEMGKNALLQQEVREKTEQLEKTRILYDSEKRSYENTIEEIKRRLQDKYDIAMKSLAEAETKLCHQESRHKCFVLEHEAVVQQLESVHFAEIIQRDTKISTACTRIEELEAIMIDRERTILEQRKDLANITMEKDATDSKLRSIEIVLEKKEGQLHEVTVMIEKLKEDLESITSKYNDTNHSLEIAQAECLELQSTVSRKDFEISEHVKDLKSLSEAYNEALEELKQTKQCLEEERKLLKCQESEARTISEDLKEKLVVLEDRSARNADALSLLEEKIKSFHNDEKINEEPFEQQCEEKKTLGRDLLGLLKKFEKLETDFFLALEKISKLELEVMSLREKNALWNKYLEVSTSSEVKSLPEIDTSVGTHLHSSWLEHLENEEELHFSAMRTQCGKLNKACTAYIIYSTIYMIYNHRITKSVKSQFVSIVYRGFSLDSAPSSSMHNITLVLDASEAKDVAVLDTDRSRVNELQRRNAMLHPAMRCAYATEVACYNSPSGSENIVKHGSRSARRKSGVKVTGLECDFVE